MSTSSPSKRRLRTIIASCAVALGLAVGTVGAAAPASAISQITGLTGYTCNSNRTLSIPVPRIWASQRTEQVTWINQVQRFDESRRVWYDYGTYVNTASFNSFGQMVNVQGWLGLGGGYLYGSQARNQLFLTVAHPGYYRIAAHIKGNQGGKYWLGYIAGENAWCYMR